MSKGKRIGNFIVQKRSIVPNMITMLNMTMGFFAIIYASKGNIFIAGVLVFIGSLFDAMDGAVARAMKVESPVGVQLDSLADGIAYGIAPAVIAYQAYLSHIPRLGGFDLDFGMIIAPFYAICAIYRLAKFNISDDEGSGFSGLPSPAAGIIIAALPTLQYTDILFIGRINFVFPWPAFIVLYIIIGLLMVASVDYTKLFSDIYKKGMVAVVITIIVIAILLVVFKMWAVFAVASLYTLAGLIKHTFRFFIKE